MYVLIYVTVIDTRRSPNNGHVSMCDCLRSFTLSLNKCVFVFLGVSVTFMPSFGLFEYRVFRQFLVIRIKIGLDLLGLFLFYSIQNIKYNMYNNGLNEAE